MNRFEFILSNLLLFYSLVLSASLQVFGTSAKSLNRSPATVPYFLDSLPEPTTTIDKSNVIIIYNELLNWIKKRGGYLSESIEVRGKYIQIPS